MAFEDETVPSIPQETQPAAPMTIPEFKAETETPLPDGATKPSAATSAELSQNTVPHLVRDGEGDTAVDMAAVQASAEQVVPDTAVTSTDTTLQKLADNQNLTMADQKGRSVAVASAQNDYKENPEGLRGFWQSLSTRFRFGRK